MDELYLIYVNVLGHTWKGSNIYEFLFSDTIENIDGDGWDLLPASGQPQPPCESLVKKVGIIDTELKLNVIQDSDAFAVWDAVDGVVALAWEDISNYDDYPEDRISFKFGDKIKMIEDQLYIKDLVLNYELDKKWKI